MMIRFYDIVWDCDEADISKLPNKNAFTFNVIIDSLKDDDESDSDFLNDLLKDTLVNALSEKTGWCAKSFHWLSARMVLGKDSGKVGCSADRKYMPFELAVKRGNPDAIKAAEDALTAAYRTDAAYERS